MSFYQKILSMKRRLASLEMEIAELEATAPPEPQEDVPAVKETAVEEPTEEEVLQMYRRILPWWDFPEPLKQFIRHGNFLNSPTWPFIDAMERAPHSLLEWRTLAEQLGVDWEEFGLEFASANLDQVRLPRSYVEQAEEAVREVKRIEAAERQREAEAATRIKKTATEKKLEEERHSFRRKTDSIRQEKDSLKRRIEMFISSRRGTLGTLYKEPFSDKPVFQGFPRTNSITAVAGWREAPVALLLSIAHGLATGAHWWLYSPRTRAENDWGEITIPSSMAEVMKAAEKTKEEQGDWAPSIFFDEDRITFRWSPLKSDNPGRFVEIKMPGGDGIIKWYAGDFGRPSTFIGSVLAILPDAEDDGTLEKSLFERDIAHARELKTFQAAYVAGMDGYITAATPDGERWWLIDELAKDAGKDGFHLGYQPRRSFNLAGEEIRFARWLTNAETKKLVEEAEPFPWASRYE